MRLLSSLSLKLLELQLSSFSCPEERLYRHTQRYSPYVLSLHQATCDIRICHKRYSDSVFPGDQLVTNSMGVVRGCSGVQLILQVLILQS